MKTIASRAVKNFVVLLLVGLFITIGHVQVAAADSIVQVTAEAQGLSLVSPVDVPEDGTFWLMSSNGVLSPDPAPLFDPSLPVYQITNGEFLVDDTGGQVLADTGQSVEDALVAQATNIVNLINQVQDAQAQPQAATSSRMAGKMMAMDDSDDDFTPDFSFSTNGLYLQINAVSNGLAYLDLFNGTDTVYAIWGTTNLQTPLSGWQVTAEAWPTNDTTNTLPFTVNAGNYTNLFLLAQDWTGVYTNGLPCWWEWYWFDSLDYSATDLDSDGNTLGYDYNNNLDPNAIQFSLQFTSDYVNSSPAYGTVTIFGGTPFYEAILINDTNEADAVWQPYTSSNVTVNLSTGNGGYNVMFGLRGFPTNAQQTWQCMPLTLYSVPLALTVTSPTNSTVCQPMIQLQGYAAESLDSVTFDVSNAAGIFTNQTGYVTSQFYDTNLLEFTTNYFQCYLLLTNGLNAITLYATDMASNTVTTNLNITFDPSTDTNPPALALIWPQNDTTIGGSNFTIQAQVSDPTALVTASISGNDVQGIVEQSGAVWVKNLPLSSGTNMVTLTATNIAGVASMTNFNVVQSPVSLTVDPISSDQLNQPTISVTGSVGDSSDTITVNGVGAYYTDDDGDWEADGVAVSPSGTASLDVEVSDSSSNSVASQVSSQPQPAMVVLMSYLDTSYIHGDDYEYTYGHYYSYENDSVNWFYSVGGEKNYMTYSTIAANENNGNGFYYETDNFAAGDSDFNPTWEYADLQFNQAGYYNTGSYAGYSSTTGPRETRTRLMIEPAGQTPAGTTTLYLVSVGAMEFSNPNQDGFNNNDYGDVPHPPEWMQINGQSFINSGITNADGSVAGLALVSGTAGIPTEVTPNPTQFVTNQDVTYNPAYVQATNVSLQIIDANTGTNLTAQTNDVIVGQQMNLYCQLSITNALLNNGLLTNFSWTIPGDAISNYVVAADSSSAVVYTNFATGNSNVVFYWADGATNRTIQCSATVFGKTITAQATFNILRPTATVTTQTGSVAADNFLGELIFENTNNFGPGIIFSSTMTIPSGFSGTNEWVQVDSNPVRKFQSTNSVWWVLTENGTGPYLDTTYPYRTFFAPNTPADNPSIGLVNAYSQVAASDNMQMWLLFKPDGGQWVPLRAVNWSWSGSATNSAGTWTLESGSTNSVNPSDFNTTTYPQWNSNVTNAVYQQQ